MNGQFPTLLRLVHTRIPTAQTSTERLGRIAENRLRFCNSVDPQAREVAGRAYAEELEFCTFVERLHLAAIRRRNKAAVHSVAAFVQAAS